MGAFNGSRCYRLTAAVVLVLIVWQLVQRLYSVGRPQPVARVSGRRPIMPPSDSEESAGLAADQEGDWQKMGQPVRVEVYYEALCPDSMNFIVDQLAPAAERLTDDVINVILVPYGKATTQREGSAVSFSCQHGPDECWANKVHACGIRQAADQAAAVRFATCLMKHYRRIRRQAEQCARDNGLQWRQLAVCAEDDAIDTDMARYGEMTRALRPPVTFIPTITVDGSQDHQGDLFSHFMKFVCSAYTARSGEKAKGCP